MYKCLSKNVFKDLEGYQLIAIRSEDIEQIRLWRNAQIEVLRQNHEISAQEQQSYFQKNIWPTFQYLQPKQILFSFLFHQTCIGYGGLTNIEWKALRAEVSFLVDPLRVKDKNNYAQDYNHFLKLLCQVAFQELHLHRLFTETFAFRIDHIQILEKFGFIQEGRLREHIFKNEQWQDSIMHGLLAQEWHHGK